MAIYKGAVEEGEEIRSAIYKVMKGYFVWPDFKIPDLTRAEMEIMFLYDAGYKAAKEIAYELLKQKYDGETNQISTKELKNKIRNVETNFGRVLGS